MKKTLNTILLALIGLPLMVSTALAEEEAPTLDTGDTAWMLTSTVLVLLMTLPGLAMFYGGLVRVKNVLSVFMQCFIIASVMSIIWVVYGYSFAAGEGNKFWGDASMLMLGHMAEDTLSGTIPRSSRGTRTVSW